VTKKKSGESVAAAKAAEIERLTSLRDHPDSGPALRRIRAAGGLAGFGVAVLIGLEQGAPFATMILRALEVGLASQVVAWAGGVLVWKRLLIAQAGAVARSRRLKAAQAAQSGPIGARVE
jgi:hypothetical protein